MTRLKIDFGIDLGTTNSGIAVYDNGKTKIFLLRRSAAEESHTNGGTVIKHPKGFNIKSQKQKN